MTKKRILIIDDEVDVLETLAQTLKSHQYQCLTLDSPENVLKLAIEWKPHLILLDLNLPKISGMGLLREIKDNPKLAHIPIIILSGLSDHDVINMGLELGAKAYLDKCCGKRELLSAVKNYADDSLSEQ